MRKFVVGVAALALVGGGLLATVGGDADARQDALLSDSVAGMRLVEDIQYDDDESGDASFGDWSVYSGVLLDESGAEIGEEHGECTYMDDEHGWFCSGILSLEDGELVTQGMSLEGAAGDESVLSVVGGTGAYANAGGELGQIIGEEEGLFEYAIVVDLS